MKLSPKSTLLIHAFLFVLCPHRRQQSLLQVLNRYQPCSVNNCDDIDLVRLDPVDNPILLFDQLPDIFGVKGSKIGTLRLRNFQIGSWRRLKMPELIPNKKFISDLEKFKNQKALRKKIAKTIKFLIENPYPPGLRIERITNDPTAWSARVDFRNSVFGKAADHFFKAEFIHSFYLCHINH